MEGGREGGREGKSNREVVQMSFTSVCLPIHLY